jgi:hypothetical protein
MKYSILFPYYKRPELQSSLVSFLHHYSRNDYEVVIVEDLANAEDAASHIKLFEIINKFKDKMNIVYVLDDLRSFNSANKYNVGFLNSTGDFIILSNPETAHEVNILNELDKEFSANPNNYIVCACKSLFLSKPILDVFDDIRNNKMNIWYQHTKHRNKQYHFCSAISRQNFVAVGGFDERYCSGIAYEDDSFIERVRRNKICIKNRDDLLTIHIDHDKSYASGKSNLIEINRNLFETQTKNNDFFEPNKINDRKPIKKVEPIRPPMVVIRKPSETSINQLSSYVEPRYQHLAPRL